MPVRARNFLDVGKSAKESFFSKENTETRCRAWISSYEHSLNTSWILLEFYVQNPARTLQSFFKMLCTNIEQDSKSW